MKKYHSPLLPPLEVPVWHIFFKKKTFSSGLMYSILSVDATYFFSTLFKGIIRKECQSFTNHGHDKTPPTVFNPLSLWLTLPRDMGVSHTQWPPSITRAILACLWFAQGLHKAQKKSKQQSRSIMFRVILCVQIYRLTQLFFQHYLRALSAKNANHLQTTDTLKRHQRYSIRYHCG